MPLYTVSSLKTRVQSIPAPAPVVFKMSGQTIYRGESIIETTDFVALTNRLIIMTPGKRHIFHLAVKRFYVTEAGMRGFMGAVYESTKKTPDFNQCFRVP